MTEDETKVEDIDSEDEINTNEASATVITEEDKKEVLGSFEITEECDPMTMDCKELQDEAQKLTKKSEALGNVLKVYDEDNPLFLKATEEKSKVDGSLTKIFDRAFGTCLTPPPEKKEEEPETD